MHILVTGGGGFIGSHLVEYYLLKNHSVHVIDNFSTGCHANLAAFKHHPKLQIIAADLLTYPELDALVACADVIYHLAAVVGVLKIIHAGEQLLETNIGATERLLRATHRAGHLPRLILASTSEVYGGGHVNPCREDSSLIVGEGKSSCTAYAVSKLALECYAQAYFQYYGARVTVLRIFNTIGPRQCGQYGMVVPRFISAALKHIPLEVYGTGMQTRSFCDVRDLVSMMDLITTSPETYGTIINVGQDEEISINALAELIKALAQSDSAIQHIAYQDAYGEGFEDIMQRVPDLSRLHTRLQYTYQWNLIKTLTDLIHRGRSADAC